MASSEPRLLTVTPPPPSASSLPVLPPTETVTYEFGDADTLILAGLASRMRLGGLFLVGIGLFVFAYGVIQMVEVGYIFAGLLDFIIGIWTFASGTEFKKIAVTENKNVSQLIRGLENLLRLYSLVYWLCLLALLFTCVQVGAFSLGIFVEQQP